jgi:hypothetical protein
VTPALGASTAASDHETSGSVSNSNTSCQGGVLPDNSHTKEEALTLDISREEGEGAREANG